MIPLFSWYFRYALTRITTATTGRKSSGLLRIFTTSSLSSFLSELLVDVIVDPDQQAMLGEVFSQIQ